MFKGSRVEEADYFDDVLTKDAGGVFEGLGIDDYESVRESVSADGLKISMNCRKCNKPRDVTLDWQELFLVGSNGPGLTLLKPNGWEYSQNNGKLYPATVQCSCGGPLCPQITPDEARERVNQAVQQGLVSRQSLQQWGNQVALYRQQHG